MPATIDLILFAIESAVKLARAGRKAKVEGVLRSAIVLPLPPSFTSLEAGMRAYVLELANSADPKSRDLFARDFEKAWQSGDEQLVRAAWLEHVRLGRVPGARHADRDHAGWLLIEQWEHGRDPLPSAVQRVAGTLADLGVDYFRGVPGALNEDTNSGRRLKALLQGLGELDLAEERWDSIIISLFTASLDVFVETEDVEDNLVHVMVAGVAQEIRSRLPSLDLQGVGAFDAEERLQRFSSMLLQSLLRGAGRGALSHQELLGIESPVGRALVQDVGAALLDLLLDEEQLFDEGWARVTSKQGFDRLVAAALGTVAAHPEVFGADRAAVRNWLRNLVEEIRRILATDTSVVDRDFLFALVELALKHARRELWDLQPDPTSEGRKPLIVEVTDRVLSTLRQHPESASGPRRWRFGLSQSDVLAIIDAAWSSISGHPIWLFSKPSRRKLATRHLPAALELLARAGRGGSAGLLKALLRTRRLEPVFAAVFSSDVLDRLLNEDGELDDPAALARALRRWLSRLAANGLAGMNGIVEGKGLFDLLLALRKSLLVRQAFAVEEPEGLIHQVLLIVADLREGHVLSGQKMVRRLKLKRGVVQERGAVQEGGVMQE